MSVFYKHLIPSGFWCNNTPRIRTVICFALGIGAESPQWSAAERGLGAESPPAKPERPKDYYFNDFALLKRGYPGIVLYICGFNKICRMRKFLLFIALLGCLQHIKAQHSETKTILFLIPFFSEEIETIDMNTLSTDEDIHGINSFKLIGFWEGAKMALRQYENENVPLRIVVKDITGNKEKLENTLKDTLLMKETDLIIGPFFAEMFQIAIQYAEKYNIPIVNPFSNRTDFLVNHENVYKLIPSIYARPATIDSTLLRRYPKKRLILWKEEIDTSGEISLYENYFNKKGIEYSIVPFKTGIDNLTLKMKENYHNIIITDGKSQASIIHNIRLLSNSSNLPSFTLVVPEEWIMQNEAEIEIFNKLAIHFFTNFFVDYQDEKTIFFISEYIERFHSPPDLKRYSFQGYDITRYFIDRITETADSREKKFFPISFDLEFKKIENGGFENQKCRLIQIENFQQIEITE